MELMMPYDWYLQQAEEEMDLDFTVVSPEFAEHLTEERESYEQWIAEAQHRFVMGTLKNDPLMFEPCTCPEHTRMLLVPDDFDIAHRPTGEALFLQSSKVEFESLVGYHI